MNHLTLQTEDTFASLLELAANNDVEGFNRSIERDPSCVDEVGLWYGRLKGSKKMVKDERTPLMVAATYGSIDVIKLILSSSDADVNRACGRDKSTALHCAASGGAFNGVDVVKLLLAAGADTNLVDANGRFPIDVIVVPIKLEAARLALEELLVTESSGLDSPLKPKSTNAPLSWTSDKKEYPIDPSLPDIKNSIYSTDEFRMYSFKVRPCSRAYSHDWTECPFVHPGENARRRDPRKFHYSCVPCPDFRKGTCRRGDMCEYAHGVFECWLHPAQYRTRLCKDGTSCARVVCFFAHTSEELRPLYVSTGSAVLSPRSNTAMVDFAAAMSMLPGSPSSVMSPGPFTPPMSPSANGMSHSNGAWSQPNNVPALHLTGSNLQSSRLRSSLNARDIPADYFNMLPDFDVQQQQLMNELSSFNKPSMSSNTLNRSGRLESLTPSNLDDLFSAENSSMQYPDQALAAAVFSPTHKSAVLNQFQQQQSIEHPMLQRSLSGRMSPRNMEPISPMSSRVSMLAQREKQQQVRSLSSRELGSGSAANVGSPINSWWGSSNRKPDWGVDELRRSSSVDEPDLSWVQSIVKESPTEIKEKTSVPVSGVTTSGSTTSVASSGSNTNGRMDHVDHAVLGAWIEQMKLDQLVAQQN